MDISFERYGDKLFMSMSSGSGDRWLMLTSIWMGGFFFQGKASGVMLIVCVGDTLRLTIYTTQCAEGETPGFYCHLSVGLVV